MGNSKPGTWSHVSSGTLVGAMQNLCAELGTGAEAVLVMMAGSKDFAKSMADHALKNQASLLQERNRSYQCSNGRAPCVTRLLPGAENLEIGPTDGTEGLDTARDVFGYIDPNFESCGIGVPSEKMSVSVHEIFKDSTFKEIFGGINSDLNSLCLTQSQIKRFVRDHRGWLRTDGRSNFFLFRVEYRFFVAGVYLRDDGRLGVCVDPFSNNYVWRSEDRSRVVVPKLDESKPTPGEQGIRPM